MQEQDILNISCSIVILLYDTVTHEGRGCILFLIDTVLYKWCVCPPVVAYLARIYDEIYVVCKKLKIF
jgi:hypothetical protein